MISGLSTAIGGLIGIASKKTNYAFLSLALGFSGGVMLYVSFVDILPEAFALLTHSKGEIWGSYLTVILFFVGIAFILITAKITHKKANFESTPTGSSKLLKTGILTALAIAIHNFPEGLVTFTATMQNPTLGIAIALAIAIHNIPEGIAVAAPIYYATGSKKRAFLFALLSGLTEPIGALVGYFLLFQLFSTSLIGFSFAFVAGVMVFISIEDLLPASREHGDNTLTTYGFISGMLVMAFSLLLFL